MIIDSIRLLSDQIGVSGAYIYTDLQINPTAGANGYMLKAVDGFDPSDTLNFVEGFDPTTGEPISDNKPQDKVLVMKVGFVPGPSGSVSSLRDGLYMLVSRALTVQLRLGETVVAQIRGRMSKIEAAHSTNSPEVVMTVECEDGLFESPTQIVVPMGSVSKSTPTFDYVEGTAPTGFEMILTLTSGLSSFALTGTIGGRNWKFGVTTTFLTGDQLILQTDRKKRRFTIIRSSVGYDYSALVDAGTVWPKLHRGRNIFATSSSAFNWNSVKYYPKFWGV